MTYRDDREALQGRVEQLEAELARARAVIERLEGRGTTVVEDGPRDRLIGVPLSLHLARRIEVTADEGAFEAMADVLRARLPAGQCSQVGRTLTHRFATYEIRVTRNADSTDIVARADHRHARQGTLLGTPGVALLAGALIAGAFLEMRLGPIAVALVLPLVVIGVFVALRTAVARGVLRERAEIAGVVESLGAIAALHATSERKRIRADGDAEADTDEAELEPSEDVRSRRR